MAYDEEIQGGGDSNYDEDEREFAYANIGSSFEGAFRGMSPERKSSRFGETRYVRMDLTDGRKVVIPARKILMERFEKASLSDGDGVKFSIERVQPKGGGHAYGLPKFFVDRQGQRPEEPSQAPAKASAKPVDDEPPF